MREGRRAVEIGVESGRGLPLEVKYESRVMIWDRGRRRDLRWERVRNCDGFRVRVWKRGLRSGVWMRS